MADTSWLDAAPDSNWLDDAPEVAPASVPAGPGKLTSLGRGAAQGATLGFGDEIQGLIQAALPQPQDAGKGFFQRYRAERDAARRTNEEARKANPGSYIVGNIAGGVAPGVLAAAVAPAAGAAGRIMQGAGLGAAAGTGESTAEDTSGLARDAAIGGTIGGAVTGAGELAANLLPKAARSLGNKFLRNKAGQISAKDPLSAEAIEAAYETGAIRPFRTIQHASDVIESARNDAGEALGAHLGKLEAAGFRPPDKGQLAIELANVGKTLRAKSFDDLSYQPYLTTAEELGTKQMSTLRDAEVLKRSLQGLAEKSYRAPSWAPVKGTAKAYEGVASRFRDAIESVVDQQKALAPDLAEQFVPLKQAYGPLAEASRVAQEGAARAAGRGIIGLPEAVMLASHGPTATVALKAGRMFLPQTAGYAAHEAGKLAADTGARSAYDAELRSALIEMLRRKKEE